MPLFEYRCEKCGSTTEFLEKADARGAHACAKCGSTQTGKMFSAFSARVAASPPACGSTGCQMASACQGGSCPMSH
jgi:putative FmdB family regulatory protein